MRVKCMKCNFILNIANDFTFPMPTWMQSTQIPIRNGKNQDLYLVNIPAAFSRDSAFSFFLCSLDYMALLEAKLTTGNGSTVFEVIRPGLGSIATGKYSKSNNSHQLNISTASGTVTVDGKLRSSANEPIRFDVSKAKVVSCELELGYRLRCALGEEADMMIMIALILDCLKTSK